MCIFWKKYHESEAEFFLMNLVVLFTTDDIYFNYLIRVISARFFYIKITTFGF